MMQVIPMWTVTFGTCSLRVAPEELATVIPVICRSRDVGEITMVRDNWDIQSDVAAYAKTLERNEAR